MAPRLKGAAGIDTGGVNSYQRATPAHAGLVLTTCGQLYQGTVCVCKVHIVYTEHSPHSPRCAVYTVYTAYTVHTVHTVHAVQSTQYTLYAHACNKLGT